MDANLPRVLVVDDDDRVRASIVRALERNGYGALEAATAEDALPHLAADRLVAAFVDLRLPGMDGHALLYEIGKLQPDMPVILVSGDATFDDAVRAVRGRACDFLTKPVTAATLIESLRAALARRGAPASGEPPPAAAPPKEPAPTTIADHVRRAADLLHAGRLRLPVLDSRAEQVRALMAKRECSVDEVLRIVERDPTLAAVVFRAANSSYYGAVTPITSLRQACVHLGNRRVAVLLLEGLVASSCVCQREPFRSMVDRFWQNAFVTARAVDYLRPHVGAEAGAALARLQGSEELYAAGLLHNVGELLVIQVLSDVPGIDPRGLDDGLELARAVARWHEEFGGALARSWNLPPLVVRTAGHHHDEAAATVEPADRFVRQLVVTGWRLALSAGYMYLPGQEQETPFEDVDALGVDGARVAPLLVAMSGWLDPPSSDATGTAWGARRRGRGPT